jgi:SNF2 family DNA or RNA helicase
VTLAEASSSPSEGIKSQIPRKLRKSRTLVLVPASLTLNWVDEFNEWVPTHSWRYLKKLRSIRSDMTSQDRLSTMQEWYSGGGVLVVSYNLFQIWIQNKGTAKRAPPLTPEDHTNVQNWLLKGPTLIIADEAHHMKNIDSEIAKTVTGFASTSRVALTGSPLSNNLTEYYAMVNFVSPDYLGAKDEFKARYVEPIQEGLYLSSTRYERATARKKLKALEHILEPKIHRRDINVLKGRLEPKLEFTITLPLTKIQMQAYTIFIQSFQNHDTNRVSNAQLWARIFILRLLCNHPYLFWEKMREKEKKAVDTEDRCADISKVCESHTLCENCQVTTMILHVFVSYSIYF